MQPRARFERLCVVTAVGLFAVSACSGGDLHLEPRFVAVNNALSSMGLSQAGSISEGSLPEGGDARVMMRLAGGRCYTFVALGLNQARDIDVRVVDEAGEELAKDNTQDRQAAAHYCPEADADYHVIVRMAAGEGGYMLASWQGGADGAPGTALVAASGQGGRGSCGRPIPLEIGRPVRGDTSRGERSLQGSCAGGEAPEQVYQFTLRQRAQVSITVQSDYDSAVYLRRSCGAGEGTEIACNDDSPNTTRAHLESTLEPGAYLLVVDGYGNESGGYELSVSTSSVQQIGDVCSNAAPLTVGQTVTGTTQGAPDYFQASCAGGARSPDRVYRLDVPQRSRVRIRQTSDHDGVLYVRSDCAQATSEVACNDDFRDQRTSLVSSIMDPGRYFVYADGYGQGAAGNFTLQAELGPDTGSGTVGDDCGGNAVVTAGQRVEVDTFPARDDFTGSCGGEGAPDVVYRIDVRSRSRLRAKLTDSEFTGVLYVRSACGGTPARAVAATPATTPTQPPAAPRRGAAGASTNDSRELVCQAFPQAAEGTLDRLLQPGRYFLVVDGQNAEAFGVASLDVQLDDLAALERTCRAAPLLRPGETAHGSTANGSDSFQASCAGGAQSNDAVYRLRLTQRSRVRVRLSSDYDGALYLRRECADTSTELACNDDNDDNRHSLVESTLDAGTYYVVVDGFRNGNNGTFSLDVEVSPP